MKPLRTAALSLLLAIVCVFPAHAVTIPFLTGPVVDEALLFTTEEATRLTQIVERINRAADVQVAVLTVRSLEGEAVESYALAVVEKWKLGKKGSDRGLLFLIAPADRRMRFEVGYGLEGDVTDAFSNRVMADYVRPYFKDSRYADGVASGLGALAEKLGHPLTGEDIPAPVRTRGRQVRSLSFPLMFFLLLLFIFLSFLNNLVGGRGFGSHRRGEGGWGGGGFGGGGFGGGGGFSGGGGGFGGGGSSSSW